MRGRAVNVLALPLWITMLALLGGCGGGDRQSLTTPRPSPASPSYTVSLFNSTSPAGAVGQVSVDSSGKVTLQLDAVSPNANFAVQFCPAPAQNYPCFDVSKISSDGSGKANATAQFPKSGSWAGDFQLFLNGTEQYQTNVPSGTAVGVYSATLLPEVTANGNGTFLFGAPPTQQGPLTSGSVTLSNGLLQVKLTGASPSTFYEVGECPVFFGSSCYTLVDSHLNMNFETDAQGNASFAVQLDAVTGDIFTVDPEGLHEGGYIAGFKVP